MRNKILSCFLFVFVCTNSWAGVWHDKCVARVSEELTQKQALINDGLFVCEGIAATYCLPALLGGPEAYGACFVGWSSACLRTAATAHGLAYLWYFKEKSECPDD